MNNTFTRIAAIAILLSFAPSVNSQTIWPGDINNNGIVNGTDWLYWGLAYGTQGNVRPNASEDWQGQAMGFPWTLNLSNGALNYAYVDAQGDGSIDEDDAQTVLTNFGKTHGAVTADLSLIDPSSSAPPFLLEAQSNGALANQTIKYDVSLGELSNPVFRFYGFTFRLQFNAGTVMPDGVSFESAADSWIDPENGVLRTMVYTDEEQGYTEITLVRTNRLNVGGHGKIGTLSVNLNDLSNIDLPAVFSLQVGSAALMNETENFYFVSVQQEDINLLSGGITNSNCPDVIDPVCGVNGITYINSCYAEAAGVTVYTPGVCFGPCIDPWGIDPDAVCPAVYDPVCGCNGETYANACEADAAGVTSWTSGPCGMNNDCFDPQLIITSNGTDYFPDQGVIDVNCPTVDEPVCACNGVTYPNACVAESSGITNYTQGSCDLVCVDPADFEPDTPCPADYNPVCACNGQTFANPCQAEIAGIQDYTWGACGGSSSWCNEATVLTCGDFLPMETTVGAGNDISYYPGCNNNTFSGPDRVYVINKTSVGDLQVGLEILTPGLDLDIFLLNDYCGSVDCITSSTTSNTSTNNEGLLLENAPIGTYYIVVDAQFAGAAGNYRLEVNCGYLRCEDAVELTCGEAYHGNNMDGHDDVSLYGCDGNIFNVENNGPEVPHTFTVTDAGEVTITLTNLHANLELFLLRSCDRGDCIEYSQNPGNSNESITEYLTPGQYYIVVDGYNGAVSDYTLNVSCENNCDLAIENITSTPASCGANSGSITLHTSGGTPTYLVQFYGPISGNFATNADSYTINNLPPGTYTIKKTDAEGCSVSQNISVGSGSSLQATFTANDAVCMDKGSINVSVNGGQAPYTIHVSGSANGTATSNTNNFVINNLNSGQYTIYIVDANGCTTSETLIIEHTGGDFYFTAQANAANCGSLGSIDIQTFNGIAPYQIIVAGPVFGGAQTNSSNFTINNLVGGTYNITIEDQNWCSYTLTVVVPTDDLDVELVAMGGDCGSQAAIQVNVNNGSAPYAIEWDGPESGSVVTSNPMYVISSLTDGSYSVTVTDYNGCSDVDYTTVHSSGSGLNVSVTPIEADCSGFGGFYVSISNGDAPFDIEWTGPSSGNNTIFGNQIEINNILPGDYTLEVSDDSGCTTTSQFTIGGGALLAINLVAHDLNCGNSGSIDVVVFNGTAPYQINWSGPESGMMMSDNNTTTIPNLPAGTYTVTVSDMVGCVSNGMIVLNDGGELWVEATPYPGNCTSTDGSIWLTITGGLPDYHITWTGPSSGGAYSNDGSYEIEYLSPGTYYIQVSDYSGCVEHIQVYLPNVPGIELEVNTSNADCNGGGIIGIDIIGGTPPYTVAYWGPVEGSTTTLEDWLSFTGLPAGSYTVKVTDANGCMDTEYVHIYDSPGIELEVNTSNADCNGGGIIGIDIIGGTPPYTVEYWGPVEGSTTTLEDWLSFTGLPAGSYTVKVTDANGCMDTEYVHIYDSPGVTVGVNTDAADCDGGGELRVDVFGGSPPYTIQYWGPVEGSGTTTEDWITFFDLPAGTYTVKVTDANGCMDTDTGIIYGSPAVEVGVNTDAADCDGGGELRVDVFGGTPPYTVMYTGPEDGMAVTSEDWITFFDLPAGTYMVKVTDANGCMDTDTGIIYGSPGIEVGVNTDAADCDGGGELRVDVVGGTPPFTVMYTGPEDGMAVTSEDWITFFDLPAGTYTVKVTDANGCMDTDEGIIFGDFDVEVGVNTGAAVCGQNGELRIDILCGLPPFTIMYTGPEDGMTTTSEDWINIYNLPPGEYTVKVTDANGNMGTDVAVILDTPSDLMLNANLIVNNCGQYNTIWIDVFGGTAPYTIEWTGPQSGSTLDDDGAFELEDFPPGEYKIKVTDAAGCMVMEWVTIYDSLINLFDLSSSNVDCGTDGSIQVDILAGMADYVITWSGPENGSTVVSNNSYLIENLPAGTYSVTVMDAAECSDTESITITGGGTAFSYSYMVNNGLCGSFSSIWLNFNGGSADYTIEWNGPVNGSATTSEDFYDILDLPGGEYTVKVTEGGGCMTTQIIMVSSIPSDLTADIYGINGSCGGNGKIRIEIEGGSGPYTINWDGPGGTGDVTTDLTSYTLPNLSAGTYTVEITDNTGCSLMEEVTVISLDDQLGVSLNVTQAGCSNMGAIGIIIGTSQAPYTISWSGPQNGMETSDDPNYMITGLVAGTYTLTLGDANGCTANETVVIIGSNGTVEADFASTINNLEASFTNNSSPGTYLWEFGDSTSSSLNNPTHTYALPGTYTVCLTVTATCGEDTYCEDVTVTVPSLTAILDVGEVTGVFGSTTLVPVYIDHVSSLVSLSGSISMTDTEVGSIEGLSAGKILPLFNANNLTFNFYDNSGVGVPLEPNDIAFYIEIQVTGDAGDATDIHITDTPLPIEVGIMEGDVARVIPHTTLPGRLSVPLSGMLFGEVHTYWNEGIEDTEVMITNSSGSTFIMTNEDGQYAMPDLQPGEMYSVEPSKDNDPANGLSTYALFIGQRFILGMNPPQITSPYQIVAGDANCSDGFSTLDLFLIQQLIIGAKDEFTDCPSWVFVSEEHDMPDDFTAYNVFPYENTTSLMMAQSQQANFVGVKVGDILGHANPNLWEENIAAPRGLNDLVLSYNNTPLSAGEEILLPITTENFQEMVSFQMELAFATEELEYVGWEASSNEALSTMVANEELTEGGRLRFSWFSLDGSGKSTQADEAVLYLRFRAKTDIADWAELLWLADDGMPAEAYDANEVRNEISLVMNTTVDTEEVFGQGYALYQNQPNPYGNTTLIRFELPQENTVRLMIHNALGAEVMRIEDRYSAGMNQIEISADQLPAGVYHYTLSVDGYTATRSMVVNK